MKNKEPATPYYFCSLEDRIFWSIPQLLLHCPIHIKTPVHMPWLTQLRFFYILLKFPIDLVIFLLNGQMYKSIITPHRKIKLFYLTYWTSTNKEDLCAQMKRTKIHALASFDSKFISYHDAYISFFGDLIQCFRGSE